MTETAELLTRPATELADLVRSGEVSSRELVQASLDRLDAVGEKVNAFVDVFADDALAEADRIGPGDERPFAGVPVAIKNNRAVAGRRLTFASELMGDFVAPGHSNVARRLVDAGCVVIGTTTLPEFGILPVTETRRFGPTRNPWDLDRTPGGSSGGSGAAVAAGIVPIAHANDGGGSTRIPAACNGLVGLKPQRGRISMAPEMDQHFLVVDGMLTRTVAETAALLDVLSGREPGDASWAEPPAEPFAAATGRAPSGLRVAVTTTTPLPDTPVHPAHADAAVRAGRLLEDLGHHVEEVEAPWQQGELLQTFTAVFGPAVALQAAFAGMIAGREPTRDDMEELSWWVWETCRSIDAMSAAGAQVQLGGFGRAIVEWTAGWDVVLTPALAEPPVPIGTIDPQAPDPQATFARSGRFTPFTAVSNVTGSPAISLPLYEHEGLPVGVQLIGQPAGEAELLALAAQLEGAQPWADRRPAL
jgi:amidase